jgi:hypothetical protein
VLKIWKSINFIHIGWTKFNGNGVVSRITGRINNVILVGDELGKHSFVTTSYNEANILQLKTKSSSKIL